MLDDNLSDEQLIDRIGSLTDSKTIIQLFSELNVSQKDKESIRIALINRTIEITPDRHLIDLLTYSDLLSTPKKVELLNSINRRALLDDILIEFAKIFDPFFDNINARYPPNNQEIYEDTRNITVTLLKKILLLYVGHGYTDLKSKIDLVMELMDANIGFRLKVNLYNLFSPNRIPHVALKAIVDQFQKYDDSLIIRFIQSPIDIDTRSYLIQNLTKRESIIRLIKSILGNGPILDDIRTITSRSQMIDITKVIFTTQFTEEELADTYLYRSIYHLRFSEQLLNANIPDTIHQYLMDFWYPPSMSIQSLYDKIDEINPVNKLFQSLFQRLRNRLDKPDFEQLVFKLIQNNRPFLIFVRGEDSDHYFFTYYSDDSTNERIIDSLRYQFRNSSDGLEQLVSMERVRLIKSLIGLKDFYDDYATRVDQLALIFTGDISGFEFDLLEKETGKESPDIDILKALIKFIYENQSERKVVELIETSESRVFIEVALPFVSTPKFLARLKITIADDYREILMDYLQLMT